LSRIIQNNNVGTDDESEFSDQMNQDTEDSRLFCSSFHILGLEPLEPALGNQDMRDEGVQLVHGVFILVSQASKTNTHPELKTVLTKSLNLH